MMKKNKIRLLLLMMCIFCATIFMCACGEKDESKEGVSIVATIFPAYDFSRQIALDNANIELLIKPGSEVHSYEPSPQDIIKINECDIFIYTGGENDKWVDEILKSVDNDDLIIIKMVDCVELFEEEVIEGMEEEEEEHGDEEGDETEWDEHVWTSPKNAIKISKVIKEKLSEIDEANNEKYEENLKTYTEKLELLDKEIRETVSNAKRNVLLFADRFPARYFVEEYNLKYYAAFPGCSSETEPSASVIAYLVDKIKNENIPAILKIELSNGNVADVISGETGAKILTFSSCHNLTKEEFSAGKTYIDIMYENLDVLKIALN